MDRHDNLSSTNTLLWQQLAPNDPSTIESMCNQRTEMKYPTTNPVELRLICSGSLWSQKKDMQNGEFIGFAALFLRSVEKFSPLASILHLQNLTAKEFRTRYPCRKLQSSKSEISSSFSFLRLSSLSSMSRIANMYG